MNPLEGVKVVSLTHYLQGPSCVQFLADLGADVVKVERIGGAYERHWSGAQAFLGDESVFFLLAGRNQRSIELNWHDPAGAEVLWRLIEEADVLVENFRPGVLNRRGFSYEEVRRRNVGIIYCSLSGYGGTGPLAEEPGQDLLIQAMSGLMSLSGRQEDPPIPVGTAVVDQHAAALGAMGVLAALIRRSRTGSGLKIDSSLLLSALDLQVEPLNYFLNGAELYPRSQSGIASRFHQAPYGVFETADGYLTLSLADGPTLAEALDEEQLSTISFDDQFTNREAVNQIVARRMREKPSAEWMAVLREVGVWHAPVNEYEDLLQEPQLASLQAFSELKVGPGRTARVVQHPIRYDGEPPPIRRDPPTAGQHTQEVLRELGYSEGEISGMRESAVLGNSDARRTKPQSLYSRKPKP